MYPYPNRPERLIMSDYLDGGSKHIDIDIMDLIRQGYGKTIPFMTMADIKEKRKYIAELARINRFKLDYKKSYCIIG